MPGLRDLLRKKEKIAESPTTLTSPEFKFIRSTTGTVEVIEPPTYPEDDQSKSKGQKAAQQRRILGFRQSSNGSVTKDSATDVVNEAESSSAQLAVKTRGENRFSTRLHIGRDRRSRSASAETSANLPEDLPEAPQAIAAAVGRDGAPLEANKEATEQREAQWEKRATVLAMKSPLLDNEGADDQKLPRSRSPSVVNVGGDVNIQEAIRLHEEGDLTQSTIMFGQLADPKGANNALAQVLYGLALRHGWGIPVEPDMAIRYLSLAASNSALVEEQALASGLRRGGAAKGELVLAIFELANCFRNGWGVKKDAVAARQYYETAANLGDTDAMEEAAWCYLEGFGGAKDKFKAAQYLRLAEEKGSKSVGNSWIWKDKYNPK